MRRRRCIRGCNLVARRDGLPIVRLRRRGCIRGWCNGVDAPACCAGACALIESTAGLPPGAAGPTAAEERELARRITSGERGDFELLMRRHNRRLFRLARAALGNAAEAEDALQEAYLSAYRAIGGFRADASLSTWLSRLVINECHGRLRKQRRRDNVIPIAQARDGRGTDKDFDAMAAIKTDSPEGALMRAEMRALIERKLDALPEVFRVVFVLRCVEEMTVEETAQCLDIPEATVRSRLFRARSMLRAALAEEIDLARHELYEFGGAHCDRVVNQVLGRVAGGR